MSTDLGPAFLHATWARSAIPGLALVLTLAAHGFGATADGGRAHSVVALPDGSVWTWGANDRGQIGDGSGTPQLTPTQVPALAGIVAVASGDDHVLALADDGTVFAWGANESGQVGDGTTLDRALPVALLTGAVGIDAGPGFSLAWAADGTLWTWGANDRGQLGDGTLLPGLTPAPISALTGVTSASAGRGHVLALAAGGLRAWGANDHGQLGDGGQVDQASPIALTAVPDASQLVAASGASYAIRSDGSLWAWGANDVGQLGDGTTTSRLSAAPVASLAGVSSVRVGNGHVLVLLADGTIRTWGSNDYGQLGDGTSASSPTPLQLGLTSVVEVAAGLDHSLAVTSDGEVFTWGRNLSGQLGDGTAEDVLTPQAISGPGFDWKVGRPVLDPPASTYEAEQTVTMTTVTSGASVRYTDDGTEPDGVSPVVPSGGSVPIDESKTLKAQAVKQGSTPSGVVTAPYTLRVPAVQFAPAGGSFSEPQVVTLTASGAEEIRYTDDGTDPDESSTLYSGPITLDEVTTLKARGYRTGWDPSVIASQGYTIPTTTAVEWIDLTGVVASGNTLTKSAGGADAWDSGAVSSKAIAAGDGWVEAVVGSVGSVQMFGLAHGNSGQGFGDIDFAFYVSGSSLYVYESGVSRGAVGSVAPGDELRVVVEGGVVGYEKNGAPLLASALAPSYPLLVDMSIRNPGGQVTNVTLSGVLTDVILEPPGAAVQWLDLVGAAASGNTLVKDAGGALAWDSGAESSKAIASGDGWVEVVVEETGSTQMFGLAHGNSGQGFGDIDFALYVSGSSLYVYESGISQGGVGGVVQGDRLRVVVEGGAVKYVRNGTVLHVSSTAPVYPLLVDTSLRNPGGQVARATLFGSLTNVVLDPPGTPVEWTDLVGVAASGNTLIKDALGASAWDSGAVSTKAIASGDGWVEAVVEETGSTQMFGLANGSSGQGYADIDFALYVAGSALYVYEGGISRGSVGGVVQGDRLRVVVESGVVRYERNGQALLTSGLTPIFPLLVDTSIKNPGGRVAAVTISGLLTDVVVSPPALAVEWTDLVGVTATDNTLEKEAGGALAWDSGAVSTRAIASGDGWVEAVVEETGSTQMFGLSHGNSGQGYADIDFALYVSGSSLYVYEGGANRGSVGSVAQGDRLRVTVTAGVVRYLRNDQELFVSSVVPSYPLLVDTSIRNPGGRIADVMICGALTDVVLEAPGIPVEWTDLVGVSADANTIEKPAGAASAWDAGAVSTKAIASGNGWVEAVVEETGSTQMFGLSHGNSGQGYADIDFALYVSGSSLYVYESGTSRGSVGSVAQGDRLRVVVESGVVKYVRNGQELLVSAIAPVYPLLVDTSVKNAGGRVSGVTIFGSLEDVVLEAPGVPVEWTDLVGVVADANTIQKSGGASAWDSGATSTLTLASGDGWVEAVVEDTTSTQMFGLSHGDDGQDFADIDFALYVSGSGLYVYEAGVSQGSVGSVAQGDRLRVVLEGGVVSYVRNGQTVKTSASTPVYPLLVDTSIKNPGGKVSQVTVSGDDLRLQQVEAPLLTPGGGVFSAPFTVELTAVTAGSQTRYTLDGTDPTPASTLYAGPFMVDTTTDLRARGFKAGWDPSTVVGAFYQFNYGTLAPPTLSPPSGVYETSVEVTLSGPAGTSVYYTTDGSTPTTTSTLYAGPFNLDASATVRAVSAHPDWTTSPVAEETYEVKVAAPVFSPAAGTYSSAQDVTITSTTPGAIVTYTTDGSEPTPASPELPAGESVHVGQSLTLRARAWKAGLTPSDLVSAAFTIAGQSGAVAAGLSHSLALTDTGDVWSWGANWSGQLGDGTTDPSGVPVLVPGLTGVTRVAAGGEHGLALLAGGSVWAWGANYSGQLGIGNQDDQWLPVQISGLAGVTAVDGGAEHSLALASGGSVWSWGANWSGQIGDGTHNDRLTPIQVPGLANVVAVAAGGGHSLALASDGSVWAWGANWSGQIGDGTYNERLTPIQVGGLPNIVAISAGSDHSLALGSDGSVWAWGANWSGQIGNGTNDDQPIPVQVGALAGVTAIAAGGGHSLAVGADGRVWAWGANGSGQIGDGGTNDTPVPVELSVPEDVVAAAAGYSHSLALTSSGEVFAWGENYEGQLGVGGFGTQEYSPVAISGPSFGWSTAPPTFDPPGGSYSDELDVAISTADPGATIHYTTDGTDPTEASPAISSGDVVHIAQTTTLRAGAWRPGANPSAIVTATYVLAAATPTAYPPPGSYAGRVNVALISAPQDAEIRYTTDGSDPTPASALYSGLVTLLADTTIRARAFPASASLEASGIATLAYAVTLPVGAVAGGDAFSMGLDPTGAVWAWGSNASGQLGIGSTTDSLDPTPVSGLTPVVEIAAGGSHALALLDDGGVMAWGENSDGQVGNGVAGAPEALPVALAGLSDVVAVAAGGRHSLALARSGQAYAWGASDSGQLGDGTTNARSMPAVVPGLTSVVAIAAGAGHSLALTADGRVWAWGDNTYLQIGNGSYDPQLLVPVEVTTDGLFVAAGAEHSLAIKSDTSGWAWGRDYEGQLGSEYGGDSVPVPVVLADPCGGEGGEGDPGCGAQPFTDVSRLAGGGAHTLALTIDGSVWSWGSNSVGQLGNGGSYAQNPDAPLAGLSDVVRIAAGEQHSLAVTATGEVWAWGGNTSGQVGDGTSDDQSTPVLVVPAGFQWRLPRPALSPPPGYYTTTLAVTATTPVAGAEVRYTTDGSEPTATSLLVTGAIPVDTSTVLLAKTFKAGLSPSATAGGAYELNFGTLDPPVANPAAGTYVGSVDVTLTAASGATIVFQLCDAGFTNCTALASYSGPIAIDRTRILWAYATQPDWTDSAPLSATYTIQVAQPVVDPAGGAYAPGQLITVSCPTPGTTLHYTTGGADPTENDRTLACGDSIPAATYTLDVKGFKDGLSPSATTTAGYSLTGDFTTAALEGGGFHSLALAPDGSVWGWGQNTNGQVGEPGGDAGLGPTRLTALAAVTGIAAGYGHSVAVTGDGYVWAWGSNASGQIGDGGPMTTRAQPVLVHGIADATSVAAGRNHSLALAADGSVWAWGSNVQGQLGDGTNDPHAEPVQVVGLSGVVAIAAGAFHSVAVKSDGTVWAWGYDFYGQLGDGGTTNRSLPVQVSGLTGVASVAAGSDHTLALTGDGHLWAWGRNTWGQLGAGALPDQSVPVEVTGLADVIAAAGGSDHTLAITSDGLVWSWGTDSSGQLGTGSGIGQRNVPGLVPGLTSMGLVAAGDLHGLAAADDLTTWGWGYNTYRQVGDWTTVSPRPAPIQTSDPDFDWLASTPTFSPASGTYTAVLSVSAISATPGAQVHYTLDGSDPTPASPLASGTITVDQSLTIKARAYRVDLAPSAIGSADYTLMVPTPLLSPSGGTHRHFVEVLVTSAVPPVSLHYTLDGNDPTESDPAVAAGSMLYISESGPLKVRGWRTGWDPSNVATATYVITAPRPLDTDGDGLSDDDELALGSDPDDPDTNGDGLPDGAAQAAGVSVTDTDVDADGLPNSQELTIGTDPFHPDTDADLVPDGTDCYPLDPSRATCPLPDPGDTTPPDVVLDEPTNAVLVGTTP